MVISKHISIHVEAYFYEEGGVGSGRSMGEGMREGDGGTGV